MEICSKRYGKELCYEDLANKFGIEIPTEVSKNVAYFDFDKDNRNIGYYGTARVGKKTQIKIENFYIQLKNEIKKEKRKMEKEEKPIKEVIEILKAQAVANEEKWKKEYEETKDESLVFICSKCGKKHYGHPGISRINQELVCDLCGVQEAFEAFVNAEIFNKKEKKDE